VLNVQRFNPEFRFAPDSFIALGSRWSTVGKANDQFS
jgi:hypothetical protein